MSVDDDAATLLDRIGVLRRPSDLDLLIFFARHPRALLSSEHLAAFLGYRAKDIAASLDLLVDGGFVSRTPHPKQTARLYVIATDSSHGDWLPALRLLAATRQGRLALIRALRRRSSATPLVFPTGRVAGTDGGPSPESADGSSVDGSRAHGGRGGDR
jgi:hypothetical protein